MSTQGSGFSTDKRNNSKTEKDVEVKGNDRRRDRSDRDNARDDNSTEEQAPRGSRSDRVKRERRTEEQAPRDLENCTRNSQWSRNGDQGRATTFFNSYKEQTKERDEGGNKLLQITGGDIIHKLSNDRGFLIYTSLIATDVYWHLLILETGNTGVKVKKARSRRSDRDRGDRDRDNNTKIYTASIDGVTETLTDTLGDWVLKATKCVGDAIFTSATVIPSDVELTDDIVAVYLGCADDANYTLADVDEPFDCDTLRENAKIRGSIVYNGNNLKTDRVGKPIRADFTIDVHEYIKDVSENILMDNDSGRTLVTVDAMVQPVYDSMEEDVSRLSVGDRYDLAAFIPEITATNFNLDGMAAGKFERLAIGLAMLPNLNTNEYYMRQFEPSYSPDPTRLVSGLAYAMDWPGDEMPLSELAQMDKDIAMSQNWLNKVFKVDEGALFSVLIREGGIGYPITKILIDLGEGDMDAFDKFMDVLDNVTDGRFYEIAKKIDGPEDIVYKLVRQPYGTYKTSTEKLPSEFIDNLAVCNLAKNTVQIIDDFAALTGGNDNRFNYDEGNTRLVAIIDEVTGRQFTMEGFETKAYLDPNFLEYLYKALQKSPLEVDVEHDDLGDSRGRRKRSIGDRRLLKNDIARRDRSRRGDRKRERIVNNRYRY